MNVLTNKSYRSYDRLSRYSNFPNYYNTLDSKYVSGTTAYLREDTTYTLHQIGSTDTLDTLALEYYNNPTYYWIIADFNRIQDPFLQLKEGEYIKIPTISSIQFNS